MKGIVQLSKNIKLEIDEQKELEVLHKAITLANPRRKCDVCGSDGIFHLIANKAKGFIFISNRCVECGATSKLGQHEDGNTYFWNEFKKYEPKQDLD